MRDRGQGGMEGEAETKGNKPRCTERTAGVEREAWRKTPEETKVQEKLRVKYSQRQSVRDRGKRTRVAMETLQRGRARDGERQRLARHGREPCGTPHHP